MKMNKFISIITLMLTLLVSCNNSQNTEKSGINTNNNITNSNETAETNKTMMVGIYVYDYPFGYLNNGQIGGFDYDLMNEIAKEADLKIDFIDMKFEELMPALYSEQIDIIIAGMTVTEERNKLVTFSKKYYHSTQTILVNQNNTNINSFNDLAGMHVGVISSTIGDSYISKIQGVNLERFDTGSTALLALKVEKLDAVVFDKVTCEHYAKNDKTIKLIEDPAYPIEHYAIAVRKNENELINKINEGLDKIMANGTYQALINKYF